VVMIVQDMTTVTQATPIEEAAAAAGTTTVVVVVAMITGAGVGEVVVMIAIGHVNVMVTVVVVGPLRLPHGSVVEVAVLHVVHASPCGTLSVNRRLMATTVEVVVMPLLPPAQSKEVV